MDYKTNQNKDLLNKYKDKKYKFNKRKSDIFEKEDIFKKKEIGLKKELGVDDEDYISRMKKIRSGRISNE